MFNKILVPVEALRLSEADAKAVAQKSIDIAAGLAKLYGSKLVIGTVEPIPEPPVSPVGATLSYEIDVETPLKAFVAAEAERLGMALESVHRPSSVVSAGIRDMVEEFGVDLVVMSTHAPSMMDWLFGSNAAATALHTDCSVFVVR